VCYPIVALLAVYTEIRPVEGSTETSLSLRGAVVAKLLGTLLTDA